MISYKTIGKHGKAPTIWLDVVGHRTNVSELALLFGMHHVTLRNRLKSKWPIAAACLVKPESNWISSTINEYAKQYDFDTEFLTKLNLHFAAQNS